MKKTSTFKLLQLSWMYIMICSSFLYGCSETVTPEPRMVSINSIKEDKSYESVPLIGGSWKLIGFVDHKSNTLQLVDRKTIDCTDCYIITFGEDRLIDGQTIANKVMGNFELLDEQKKLIITNFGLMSYAGELKDGDRFVDAMKKVNSYTISSQGLALNYDKHAFLLFEPIAPIIPD